MEFVFSRATRVAAQWSSVPVQRAIRRLRRDMEMTLTPSDIAPNNEIVICLAPKLPPEGYTLDLQDEHTLIVCAADDLGAVYAMLYLSRTALGVTPLWFWNDQAFEQKPLATITQAHYASVAAAVPLRGWALENEPLLEHWAVQENHGWEMAFEALLRCGGNMVLAAPGPCQSLAAEMGLWLAQPGEEPLGAAPFSLIYPHLVPAWPAQSEAYHALWVEAVRRGKGRKTVWNLAFHGENGRPFWEHDPACITMEQRGRRLGEILRLQYDLVREAAPTAPVCTRLEGEEASLYRAGVLELPPDVILLWPDDGSAHFAQLPQPEAVDCRHGVICHLGGHDGRAAASLTMLPEPAETVRRELCAACESGAKGLWLLHAPGIKPHLYLLELAAALWQNPAVTVAEHRAAYLRTYYRAQDGWALSDSALDDLSTCLKAWGDSTVPLQPEGRRAGEELMNYGTRAFATAWLCGQTKSSVPAMRWLAGDRPFGEQLSRYRTLCVDAMPAFETLLRGCEYAGRATTRLWRDSVLLQARLYLLCLQGSVRFCDACALYFNEDYKDCFVLLGQAADDYTAAATALQNAGHGRWAGFYQNECFVQLPATARLLRSLMALVRAKGEGPLFTAWQHAAQPEELCAPCLADDALYQLLRGQLLRGQPE